MASGQGGKIEIRHMICAGNALGKYDSIIATQVITNKKMPRIRNKLANHSEGFLDRLPISQHYVGGNPDKSHLAYWAGGKSFNGTRPSACNAIMIMIFPEESNKEIDVQ